MKRNEKQIYEAPDLKVLIVELEQGIASASASPDSAPTVDDWGTGPGGGGNWEGS